jgi:hypothetical protein
MENLELKMQLEAMKLQNQELLEKKDKHFKQEMHYRQLCATMQNKVDKLSNKNDKFDIEYFENKLKNTINEINNNHTKSQPPASDILDEIKGQASVNHISTESEIDILDEINMNATVKPLHKSTAQDKTKTFKKFIAPNGAYTPSATKH